MRLDFDNISKLRINVERFFVAKLPKVFTIDCGEDIATCENYFLYILLDNIFANQKNKYILRTGNVELLTERIKSYDKLYCRNTRELIKVENKKNYKSEVKK